MWWHCWWVSESYVGENVVNLLVGFWKFNGGDVVAKWWGCGGNVGGFVEAKWREQWLCWWVWWKLNGGDVVAILVGLWKRGGGGCIGEFVQSN